MSEIRKAVRKNPVLGGEGAVTLLERLSPALERIDSSSGAIGSAVNRAIEDLVPIIARAPASPALREKWLDRLWEAVQNDEIPYLETLIDFWGDLCADGSHASKWADDLGSTVRLAWSPDPSLRGYFKGTSACLSALLKAGRYAEIIELLELAPHRFWYDRKWGVRALVAMGRMAEALQYAESSCDLNDSPIAVAQACEEIMLSSGMADEAYARYAMQANVKTTYAATFRTIAAKYPHIPAPQILEDLVAGTPGMESKWFAAAKDAGLYQEAIELANRTPCDPKTLIRAARDMVETRPQFAAEAGIAALRWLVAGYGYEITGLDVWAAFDHCMKAADLAGCKEQAIGRVRRIVEQDCQPDHFVLKILGPKLGLDPRGGLS
ncbi:MAG TPA: hypothetical protein VE398_08735 [Acidobacteriota bacterium]|nr:hypothetical protein [Acidobacteriota bacterium]